MRRLCTDSACSYSGRAVQRAARVTRGVELRPRLKSLDVPSNPKVTVIATDGWDTVKAGTVGKE